MVPVEEAEVAVEDADEVDTVASPVVVTRKTTKIRIVAIRVMMGTQTPPTPILRKRVSIPLRLNILELTFL